MPSYRDADLVTAAVLELIRTGQARTSLLPDDLPVRP